MGHVRLVGELEFKVRIHYKPDARVRVVDIYVMAISFQAAEIIALAIFSGLGDDAQVEEMERYNDP